MFCSLSQTSIAQRGRPELEQGPELAREVLVLAQGGPEQAVPGQVG